MNTDDKIPLIIAAAVAAVGKRPSRDRDWADQVMGNIPAIAAMMDDGNGQLEHASYEWQEAHAVLDADVFTAVFKGFTVEETSKRCLVQLGVKKSKRYKDGIEPIRSHPTWSARGRMMQARLEQLQVGDEILVWKALETKRDDPDEKVRVLVHFKFLRRPKDSDTASTPSAVSESRPPSSTEEVQQPPTAPSSGGSAEDERAFSELDVATKARVRKRLIEERISFPVPQEDKANRFHSIITEEASR